MTRSEPDFMDEVHLLSVCGPIREENEDVGVAWRDDGGLVVIVADGMGGHSAGREAAEIVARTCRESLRNRGAESWEDAFRGAIGAAQQAVRKAAGDNGAPGRAAMGSTVALAVVDGLADLPRLHVAHVGDSRVYLYRGRSLYRLTADHSLVGQMVRDGLLREDEAFGHPDSNVIQRAVGQSGPLEPEVQEPIPLDGWDTVLLCSDGLHGALQDEAIGEIIGRSGSAEEVCQNLLAAALEAGSQDNVTIGCARIIQVAEGRRPTQVQV
jgi:serine/threonine protein phosphatase PrpC